MQQNAFLRHILRCLLRRKQTRRRRRNANVSQACSLLPTGRSVFLPNRPRPAATLRTQARWPRSATCQAPLGDSPVASVTAFGVTSCHRRSFPSLFFFRFITIVPWYNCSAFFAPNNICNGQPCLNETSFVFVYSGLPHKWQDEARHFNENGSTVVSVFEWVPSCYNSYNYYYYCCYILNTAFATIVDKLDNNVL